MRRQSLDTPLDTPLNTAWRRRPSAMVYTRLAWRTWVPPETQPGAVLVRRAILLHGLMLSWKEIKFLSGKNLIVPAMTLLWRSMLISDYRPQYAFVAKASPGQSSQPCVPLAKRRNLIAPFCHAVLRGAYMPFRPCSLLKL